MWFFKLLVGFAALAILVFVGQDFYTHVPPPLPSVPVPSSPLDVSVTIDGAAYALTNGIYEHAAASSSASLDRIQVFGEPFVADVDGDLDDDALLMLTRESGGSGTFYYLAVAENTNGTFVGSNAEFLGDRIAPQNIAVRNGVTMVNFADRAPDEPMSARPSRGVTRYFTVEDGALIPHSVTVEGEQVLFGYMVYGHEARTFRECGEAQPEMWIDGSSHALSDVARVYEAQTGDVTPGAYAPLFAVVAGKIVDAPEDGFGADYEHALKISQVIKADRYMTCKSDSIILMSPLPGSVVTSPVSISGFARGTWFFEGDFPATLVDWDGRILAEGYVSAESDWMSSTFVPFSGELIFASTSGKVSDRGALILKKDNPSGDAAFDDALEIPVRIE